MSRNKNFYEEYSEPTLLKLELFRRYIESWLPTFISKVTYPKIYIFDFFAGPGCDKSNNSGSSKIIIEEVSKYLKHENIRLLEIKVFFNVFKKKNYQQLKMQLDSIPRNGINFEVANKRFKIIFNEWLPYIQDTTSVCLVFLDQFGVKFANREIFKSLTNCNATDLIFFSASSTFKRFKDHKNILKYFPDLDTNELDHIDNQHIHEYIAREYYAQLPCARNGYLGQFSIYKSPNMYGLIFYSNHPSGIEKFLDIAWEIDSKHGCANYDFKGGRQENQLYLFDSTEDKLLTKQEAFGKELYEYIKKGGKTNHDVYKFSLLKSFPPKIVNEVLRNIQREYNLKVIKSDGNPAKQGGFFIGLKKQKCKFIIDGKIKN
ncbi:MAG: three-Cys-motif partner protein TcmP [bacterium]|nr:three-Cys-motif partner protein TcmP [bacterium]